MGKSKCSIKLHRTRALDKVINDHRLRLALQVEVIGCFAFLRDSTAPISFVLDSENIKRVEDWRLLHKHKEKCAKWDLNCYQCSRCCFAMDRMDFPPKLMNKSRVSFETFFSLINLHKLSMSANTTNFTIRFCENSLIWREFGCEIVAKLWIDFLLSTRNRFWLQFTSTTNDNKMCAKTNLELLSLAKRDRRSSKQPH